MIDQYASVMWAKLKYMKNKKVDYNTLRKAFKEAVSLLVLNTDMYSSYESARGAILSKVSKKQPKK